MKKIRLFLILSFSFGLNFGFAQTNQFKWIDSIAVKDILFFDVDALGQIYTVDQQGVVMQYNSNFKPKAYYRNIRYGAISHIDVSNPFRIMVFYENFQMIEILDKAMTKIVAMPLNEMGFGKISAASMTRDRKFRVFDATNQQLLRLDNTGNTELASQSLYQILGKSVNVNRITEHETEVFLHAENEILVFDLFGLYVSSISIEVEHSITTQANDADIVYFTTGKIGVKHRKNWDKPEFFDLPFYPIKWAKIQQNQLYLQSVTAICVYQW